MLARTVNEGTKRSKKKGSAVMQKERVDKERTQEELFGRKMNSTKKMRKGRNNECKCGISKTQTLQLRRQRTLKGYRAIGPRVTRLRHDLKSHFSCSENITSLVSLRVRRAGGAKKVTSTGQGVTRHQDTVRTMGARLALVFSFDLLFLWFRLCFLDF